MIGYVGGSLVSVSSCPEGTLEAEAVKDVRAFVASAKLRLYDAFSAQMAHWSSDRAQYLPRWRPEALSVLSPDDTRRRAGNRDDMIIGFACDASREKRLLIPRVLMRGSKKSRNS